MPRTIDFEPAYLLSTRPYRETSLLLEAFTAGHGRVGLVARGARGPKSRQRGLLQAFRPLLLSWRETGELGSLNGAESAGAPTELSGERVFHGWYLNELLLKLLQRHDLHADLYRSYVRALARLASDAAEPALRRFEKQLLAELGYALPLDADFDPALRYHFDGESAPRVTLESGGFAGSSLIALRDERFEGREVLRDARRILRAALARQLGGRELETPRLLRAMRAQALARTPAEPNATGD